jgi:protein TonB
MFFRMLFSLPGAALVAGLLFLAMAALVKRDAGPIGKPPPAIGSILPEIIERPEAPPKPPRPNLAEAPDPVDTTFNDPSERPGGVTVDGLEFTGGEGGGPIGVPDVIPQPIFRVAPQYPENCRSRGIEGSVVVEFDVTPAGDVINARVAQSSNSCLNNTALRAVEKWKYNPRIDENGRAVAQRGLTEYFAFELEDA